MAHASETRKSLSKIFTYGGMIGIAVTAIYFILHDNALAESDFAEEVRKKIGLDDDTEIEAKPVSDVEEMAAIDRARGYSEEYVQWAKDLRERGLNPDDYDPVTGYRKDYADYPRFREVEIAREEMAPQVESGVSSPERKNNEGGFALQPFMAAALFVVGGSALALARRKR